jgi:hypothetical protein
MAGFVALAGVALFAAAFFARFLSALSRERRHSKVCVLLRKQPDGRYAQVASEGRGRAKTPAIPVIVMPEPSAVGKTHVSRVWSKVG